jgi:phage terminase large subunit-like protein
MNEAERVITFIETFCTLGGDFLGQPFIVQPYQREIIEDIYRPGPGGRLRSEYLLGMPRKNTKSHLGAALALYHLFADPYAGQAEVISAAGDRHQAGFVFNAAKRMVENGPLSAHAETFKNSIVTDQGGTYERVSADAGLQHGANPSFLVVELGRQRYGRGVLLQRGGSPQAPPSSPASPQRLGRR